MVITALHHNKNCQFEDTDTVCYCFSYTKENIESDFLANGYSKILEKIRAEKKNHGCSCETKNPSGR